MAQDDRWIKRILDLPVFDSAFAEAICKTPLCNVAFVSAMGLESGSEFSEKVAEWGESLDSEVVHTLLRDPAKLETFWSITTKAEKAFLRSSSFQLGFGLCETIRPPNSTARSSSSQRFSVKPLVATPSGPNKRLKNLAPASGSATPLLDHENAVKAKVGGDRFKGWTRSKAFHFFQDQSDELSSTELARLRQLVLLSGAPRTMAAHVGAYERFEKWALAHSVAFYPLTVDKVLKYGLSLDQQECGPSVVPSLKTALKWVTSRLNISCPDLEDKRLKALQDQIVAARATTVKEAVPIPLVSLAGLEGIVCDSKQAQETRLFVWWLLCMVYASLRFDDAIHVKPSELIMQEEGLFGVAWQTKVERKRAGTRFMVPKVGFKHDRWLETGWDLFLTTERDRDFWIPELNTRNSFMNTAPTHTRSVQWLRAFTHQVTLTRTDIPQLERFALCERCKSLTAHSCRVTLLDAAVHPGRSTEEIGLQANWKNPGPLVLKYTRNRSSVPATMIKQLVRELVQENHPVLEDADTVLVDSAGHDLETVEFFMKTPAPGSYYDYKYHVNSISDLSVSACNRVNLQECESVGTSLPSVSLLCKACSKSRPDVAAFFTK